MNQLDREVALRLTRYYVLALTMVAVLTSSGLWFVKSTISDLNDDSRVVNVAGRQRMLSQQLTKLAVLRTQNIVHADQNDFGKLVEKWNQSQTQLKNGMLRMEKEYTVRKSAQLDSMFSQLQPVFGSMYDNFRLIDSETAPDAEKSRALLDILAKEPRFSVRWMPLCFASMPKAWHGCSTWNASSGF